MSLCSVNDVKTAKGISGTGEDTRISNLIGRVQAMFDSYCNRVFEGADWIEYFDGKGLDSVWVSNPPIYNVTALYDSPDRTYGDGDLMDAEDYVIHSVEGRIRLVDGTFGDGVLNVKVHYKGGYGSGYTTPPGDLVEALIEQVIFIHKRLQNEDLGVTGRSLQDGSITFEARDLLPSVKMVLDRYRLRPRMV